MRGNDTRENSCTIFGRPRADGRGGSLKIADLKFDPCLYKVHNLHYKKKVTVCVWRRHSIDSVLCLSLLLVFLG